MVFLGDYGDISQDGAHPGAVRERLKSDGGWGQRGSDNVPFLELEMTTWGYCFVKIHWAELTICVLFLCVFLQQHANFNRHLLVDISGRLE